MEQRPLPDWLTKLVDLKADHALDKMSEQQVRELLKEMVVYTMQTIGDMIEQVADMPDIGAMTGPDAVRAAAFAVRIAIDKTKEQL